MVWGKLASEEEGWRDQAVVLVMNMESVVFE